MSSTISQEKVIETDDKVKRGSDAGRAAAEVSQEKAAGHPAGKATGEDVDGVQPVHSPA